MKSVHEQIELLRAAVVLAVADGTVSSSEKGLLKSIAYRVGIGQMSLEAMIERAKNDSSVRDELFTRTMSEPDMVLELLVAAARLDGQISEDEREVLVHMMDKLSIPTARFGEIYQRGIKRADALRQSKFGSSGKQP